MVAMKCDRCDKYYEQYEGRVVFPTTGKANRIRFEDACTWNDDDPYIRGRYDLCPECMTKLQAFMKMEEC